MYLIRSSKYNTEKEFETYNALKFWLLINKNVEYFLVKAPGFFENTLALQPKITRGKNILLLDFPHYETFERAYTTLERFGFRFSQIEGSPLAALSSITPKFLK